MAFELSISSEEKSQQYEELLPQIKALISGESDLIANLGNICSALKYSFNFFWVGFYKVNESELVLAPFQGPIACTRINKGKGVCGESWEKKQAIIIDDVDKYTNHIACSSLSKSEIVLPIFNKNNEVVYVLDIDSEELATFDETDKKYLLLLVQLIETII